MKVFLVQCIFRDFLLHVILEPVPEESEQRQDNHQTVAHLNVGGAVAEISRTSAHNERGGARE